MVAQSRFEVLDYSGIHIECWDYALHFW